MHSKSFLNESLSKIAYHYTNGVAALNILKTGNFELSSSTGNKAEQQYALKGYPYFLSCTRTKLGGYHQTVGTSAALFVLNGDWFNQHYPSRPIDYWLDRDPFKHGIRDRQHEAEDRVYSRTPTIPINGVTAIHFYISPTAGEHIKAKVRQAMIQAKRRNIKTYLYNDMGSWRKLDTRNLGSFDTLKGIDTTKGYVSTHPGYLIGWIELLKAKDKSQLSKKADSLRYGLMYNQYDRDNAAQGLATELSNARKPNSGIDRKHASEIIKFMQQNKMNTVEEFVNALAKKWNPPKKQEVVNEIERLSPFDQDDQSNHLDWMNKEFAKYWKEGLIKKIYPYNNEMAFAFAKEANLCFIFVLSKDESLVNTPVMGLLEMEKIEPFPINNTYKVSMIGTGPQFQGKGVGTALYTIALKILKITLLSDTSQTPGGRRNWVRLNQLPGVQVQGLVAVRNLRRIDNPDKLDDAIDSIMHLGGEYLGSVPTPHLPVDKQKDYFLFNVHSPEGAKELEPEVNTKLKLYHDFFGTQPFSVAEVRLIARWVG